MFLCKVIVQDICIDLAEGSVVAELSLMLIGIGLGEFDDFTVAQLTLCNLSQKVVSVGLAALGEFQGNGDCGQGDAEEI